MLNIMRKVFTRGKATVQITHARSQDCVEGITTYYANGAYNVLGRLGGHIFKTRHLSEKGARDSAREMLYLYLNGELI